MGGEDYALQNIYKNTSILYINLRGLTMYPENWSNSQDRMLSAYEVMHKSDKIPPSFFQWICRYLCYTS